MLVIIIVLSGQRERNRGGWGNKINDKGCKMLIRLFAVVDAIVGLGPL